MVVSDDIFERKAFDLQEITRNIIDPRNKSISSRMRMACYVVGVGIAAFSWSAGGADARKYTAQVLASPPGATFVIPSSINNNGDIIGNCQINGPHFNVFLHNNQPTVLSPYTPTNTPYANDSSTKLNDIGNYIGYALVGGAPNYPVVNFLQNLTSGSFTRLVPPLDTDVFSAIDINNQNVVVGTASKKDGSVFHAVMAYRGATAVLPVLPGSMKPGAEAEAVNNLNQIVGRSFDSHGSYETVMWRQGRITDLNAAVVPMSINDAGDIAGYDYLPTALQTPTSYMTGYLWSGGKWINFGRMPGFENIYATHVNANGVVLGSCDSTSDPNNIKFESFLWCDGVLSELSSLVINIPGMYNVSNVDLNDRDQIVCFAYLPGQGVQGFLLTPAQAAAPRLTSVEPSQVGFGAQNVTLTLTGTGFENDTTLSVNGAPRLHGHWISSTQMTFPLPSSATELVGRLSIAVYTPPAGGGTSNNLPVDVQSNPLLTNMTPDLIARGTSSPTLTLTGANFGGDTVVTVNDKLTLSTTVLSSTKLTAVLPQNVANLAGLYYVRVVNQTMKLHSNILTLTIARPAPTIVSVSPGRIPAGLARFSITVVGKGVTASSGVSFNGGAPVTPTSIQNGSLVAPVPPAILANAGDVQVRIVNALVDGGSSARETFSIASRPVLTTITPGVAITASTDVTLTLTGANFEPGSIVTFDGAYATAPKVVSASELKVVVPNAVTKTPGAYSVSVVNPGYANYSNPQTLTVGSFPPPPPPN